MKFLERTTNSIGRIDRAKGVLHGVKFVGLTSTNGRRYTRAALERAVPLYNNIRIYDGHEGVRDGISNVLGWSRNTFMGSDGVYGEAHLLMSHPKCSHILEIAERNPSVVGFSHEAAGKSRLDADGVEIVESITRIHGLALVCEPATTSGLFESNATPTNSRSTALDQMADRVFESVLETLDILADGQNATSADSAIELVRDLLTAYSEEASSAENFGKKNDPLIPRYLAVLESQLCQALTDPSADGAITMAIAAIKELRRFIGTGKEENTSVPDACDLPSDFPMDGELFAPQSVTESMCRRTGFEDDEYEAKFWSSAERARRLRK